MSFQVIKICTGDHFFCTRNGLLIFWSEIFFFNWRLRWNVVLIAQYFMFSLASTLVYFCFVADMKLVSTNVSISVYMNQDEISLYILFSSLHTYIFLSSFGWKICFGARGNILFVLYVLTSLTRLVDACIMAEMY